MRPGKTARNSALRSTLDFPFALLPFVVSLRVFSLLLSFFLSLLASWDSRNPGIKALWKYSDAYAPRYVRHCVASPRVVITARAHRRFPLPTPRSTPGQNRAENAWLFSLFRRRFLTPSLFLSLSHPLSRSIHRRRAHIVTEVPREL